MQRRFRFNTKRKILKSLDADLESLAASVDYGGNPEHKKNPGDFGFRPILPPRPDKSLCDDISVFQRDEALSLLRAGIKYGLISEQFRQGFPQNVWMVTEQGVPVEAQLENPAKGIYHGYPMPPQDPFRDVVLERWNELGGGRV